MTRTATIRQAQTTIDPLTPLRPAGRDAILPAPALREPPRRDLAAHLIRRFPLGAWDLVPAAPVAAFALCLAVPRILPLQGVAWGILAVVLALRMLSLFRHPGEELPLIPTCLAASVMAFMCQSAVVDFIVHGQLQGPPGFAPPRPDSAAYAGFSVAVFYWVVVLAMRLPVPGWLVRKCSAIHGPRNGMDLTLAVSLLMGIGLVPYVVLSDAPFVDLLLMGRSGGLLFDRTGLGTDARCLYTFWLNAWPAAVWLASYGLLYVRMSPVYKRILACLMVFGMIMTLSIGGRTYGASVLLAPVAMWAALAFRRRAHGQLVAVGLAVLAAGAVMQLQAHYRDVGWNAIEPEAAAFTRAPGLDLTTELALIYDTYPDEKPFYGGQNLLIRAIRPIPDLLVLFLTNPVPRTWWPDKPVDPSWTDYNYYRAGVTGAGRETNITPTIVGRSYMKYGFVGVLEMAVLYGWLWAVARRLLNAGRLHPTCALFGAIGMLYLMGSVRNMVYSHYPIVILVCLMVLTMLLWPRVRRTA